MSTYTSGYSMGLDLHNEMIKCMAKTNITTVSQYISMAVRNENRKHIRISVDDYLEGCSEYEIGKLKEEIKKREL